MQLLSLTDAQAQQDFIQQTKGQDAAVAGSPTGFVTCMDTVRKAKDEVSGKAVLEALSRRLVQDYLYIHLPTALDHSCCNDCSRVCMSKDCLMAGRTAEQPHEQASPRQYHPFSTLLA